MELRRRWPVLSPAARAAILAAEAVNVSPISFFEIGQKVRLGKWPEMAPHAERLGDVLREQGGSVAPFTPEIRLRASLRAWAHRDPFDRLIARNLREHDHPARHPRPGVFRAGGIHSLW